MATNPTFKATMLAQRLAESLKIRMTGLAFVESVGTNGDPIISIGPGTTRGANAVIRIVPEPTPTAKDIFGNASPNPATPHIVQLATEANFAGTTDNIADNLTRQQLGNILCDVFGTGCYVEWYEEADGTVPSETTFAANKLKASIAQNLWQQLMGQ